MAATSATYQWQVSIDGGVTWNNIPTATAASLTIPSVTAALNNTQYRSVATNTCGSTTSNAALLTVNPATTITSSPTGVTVCSGSNASFCVTASGNNLTYQWEMAVDCTAPFTNVVGGTTSCLNITNAVATAVYRCKVTGSCGATVTSNCAQLTVGALATVTEQPTNKEICTNGNTSFAVDGTSIFPITYQWQVSNDGGSTWSNINGATSTILTLSNVGVTQNNSRYRCQLFTTACPTPANSNSAVLTVRALPTVGLSASPLTSLLPGQSTVLQATPSLPSSGSVISKTWIKDGAPFVYTGNLYAANVEKVGSYQLSVSETYNSGLTCSNLSPIVTLTAPRSDKLFIFPIPNDGKFTVSYYNITLANSSRTITVYDAKGSKVYHKQMTITGPYTLLNVDIKPAQGGMYVVVVSDDKGNKLAQGQIIVK